MPSIDKPLQAEPVTRWQETAARLGGLTFGVRDSDGIFWVLNDVPKIYDVTLEGETGARAWRDGDWIGRTWIRATRMSLNVGVRVPPNRPGLVNVAVDKIKNALPLRESDILRIRDYRDYPLGWQVRCEDKIQVKKHRVGANLEIPLVAASPFAHPVDWGTGATVWDVYETGIPKKSGGLRIPFAVPFIIKSAVVAGELRFIVGGSARPLSQIIISGPVKNPVIRDAVAGWRVAVNLDIQEGERLVIDPGSRTVELNGASRRGAISGGFPVIDVGEHLITWSADGYTPEARLKIRVAESYL